MTVERILLSIGCPEHYLLYIPYSSVDKAERQHYVGVLGLPRLSSIPSPRLYDQPTGLCQTPLNSCNIQGPYSLDLCRYSDLGTYARFYPLRTYTNWCLSATELPPLVPLFLPVLPVSL